jgi:uncharacterized protein DUF5666
LEEEIMKKQVVMVRIGMALILVLAMIAATGCTGVAPTDPAVDSGQATEDNSTESVEPSETAEPTETPEAGATDDSSDGSEIKVEGTVESINGNTVMIDGVSYTLPADIVAQLKVGDVVKIEAVLAADGTLSEVNLEVEDSEVELTETPEPTEMSDDDQGEDSNDDSSDDSSDDGSGSSSGGGSDDSGGDD